MNTMVIQNDMLRVTAGNGSGFICVEHPASNQSTMLSAPVFEVEGRSIGGGALRLAKYSDERSLPNGGTEVKLLYGFEDMADVTLTVYLRWFSQSPFIRFRYELSAYKSMKLTKKEGCDNVLYTGFTMPDIGPSVTEIQFAQFVTNIHSFVPGFDLKNADELAEGCKFPGPIVYTESGKASCLLAYEHGAEYPDTYLAMHAVSAGGATRIGIRAEKGNYYRGQDIGTGKPFMTPWFHFALCGGGKEELLRYYRDFLLKYICENAESRKPYIFYNTWNYQERNRYFKDWKYLDSMNQEQMLKEIDIAHAMGIDVFVIDTGWFGKTGDWIPSLERFPDALKDVKAKLDSYGMKLGLWFNPVVAARTSEIYTAHPEYAMSHDGKTGFGPVWETEESTGMCLASDYADYYIQKMVRLNKELGVTYFKWDAVGQYGCNSPLHNHGTEENSPEERRDCYSYQMGLEMIRIVEEATRLCPGIIVDFDVTEGGRFVGLGFLSVGKYFLVNNGPYAFDFDIPEKFIYYQKEPVRIDPWTNIFFYPGAARPRFCRQGVRYDAFMPSILFLTHYLPDAPRYSQNNSLASLVLGGNGIWGDLLSLTEEDIRFFSENLACYKQVADAVTGSYPRVKGFIGTSPEIHEKIDPEQGKGIVCFFTHAEATYTHITQKIDREAFAGVIGADTWELTPDGRLKITVTLAKDDARVVYVMGKG